MKLINLCFYCIIIFNKLHAQDITNCNIWGNYSIKKDFLMELTICEENKWHFTNCFEKLEITAHNTTYTLNCDFFEIDGYYKIKEKCIFFFDESDSLFFLMNIIDTLNLQVVFARKGLEKDEYLNRYTSFFQGHYCYSFPENFELIKWYIESDKNELIKFKKPCNILISKDNEVIELPNNYWKKNEN